MEDDGHMLVGRITSVTDIKPLPEFRGWRLEIECLPGKIPSGHLLVVYVFPPAWKEGTPPRKGQMVEGTIWLQGSWIGGDEVALPPCGKPVHRRSDGISPSGVASDGHRPPLQSPPMDRL
jgi:hypothetical protein